LALAEVHSLPAPVGSPEWRRDRLVKKLDERREKVNVLEAYYDGNHPLPSPPQRMAGFAEARQAFENLSRLGVTNYMPPVVDVVEQRLRVTGFRFGETANAKADDEAWRIWQRNHLDADSQLVHHNALMTGQAFMLVWPVNGVAQITPEHPAQTIIEYVPGSLRERAAGLRSWCEDDGSLRAVLYLPEEVYKWQAKNEQSEWVPWQPSTDDSWPIKNPLGVVPLVEFRANRSLRPAPFGGGASEFAGVITDQDRINKTVFDRLVTAEFQAFRQRWAVGWTPDDPNQAMRASVAHMLAFEDGEVKLGEFTQADFSPFLAAVAADVEAIGARTSTPFYSLGKLANPPSGDALMALQSGLIAKSEKHTDNFGESHEEVIALGLIAEGNKLGLDVMSTVLWRSVTFVTFAEKADAAVKYKAADVPTEAIWTDVLGFTPQDVARFRIQRASQALLEPDVTPASGVQ
jgi:hypothetical protein